MVFDPLGYLRSPNSAALPAGMGDNGFNRVESNGAAGVEDGSDEEEVLDVETTMTPTESASVAPPRVNLKVLSSQLQCLRTYVLEPLLRHGKSSVFRKPVDPVLLGIPDYPKIITIPMDLGTIRDNLRGNKYSSLKDCIHDIELVWKNAKKFNPVDHFVHKIAMELEDFTKQKLSKIDFSQCKYLGTTNGSKNRRTSAAVIQNGSRNSFGGKTHQQEQQKKSLFGTFTPKDPMVACREIIEELLSLDTHRSYVAPFRDMKGLNLNRIASWLKKSVYVHPTQVLEDIRTLVGRVYRRYPLTETIDTYLEMNLASHLLHKFEVMYARRVFLSEELKPDLGNSSVYTQQLLLAQNSMLSIQNDLQSLFTGFYLEKSKSEKKRKLQKPVSPKKSASKKQKMDDIWSQQQIFQLQARIGLLNEHHQAPILSLMHKNGEKVTEDEDGYVILDIEEASVKSLHDIKKYIDSLPVAPLTNGQNIKVKQEDTKKTVESSDSDGSSSSSSSSGSDTDSSGDE